MFTRLSDVFYLKKAVKRSRNVVSTISADCFVNIKYGSKQGKQIPYKFLLYPLLSAEPDLNPAMNGA